MGNCCPCVKSETNTRSSVAPGNYSLSSSKLEDSETYHPSRSEELEDSSLVISSEVYVNGSGLENRDSKGEMRRPFYVLIPPLVGRGSNSSGDIKKTNNNTINGALSTSGMGNGTSTVEVLENNLVTFYENYCGNIEERHEDAITADGILHLCADLDLAVDDFRILLFAWKCDAAQMGKLSKNEFLQGCRLLGTDSVRSLKFSLEQLVKEVEDSEIFSDVYRYAFRFALDVECGQRSLPVDVAVSLWRLVFTHRPALLLDRWIEFLEQTPPPVRAIPRDTWCMFLHLVDAVGNDLSRYDDTEAWPSLFDDFVEWANDRANQNVLHAKEELH
ncbi:DCN1-like protein 3 [Daphnia carinata]|uniref:DCN1-like protein 3 n=1 Tax=Daphnia carinata TaxID=120202 RepID=UPI00257C0FD4|nr:DCN1-like protein 3 [Daphnia carinata]